MKDLFTARERMRRATVSWLVVLASVVAAPPAEAQILEQILVKVNGDIITRTELEDLQVAHLRQRGGQLGDEELKAVVAEITPQLLAEAIDELLLVQRGRELGYRMTDEQFAEIVERIKKENNLGGEEQFQAALKQEGLTMAGLRRSMERQMLINRVQQVEVVGNIGGITEVESRQYYEAHGDLFRTPATVTLREILVAAPASDPKGVNVALDEDARAKVEAARRRVLAGEEFATVAAEVSDAPSKANGGLIGPVDRDELAPGVQQLLGALKVGEVGEPIRTPRGYQILKLEAATEAVPRPYAEVREEIADRIFDDRRRAELAKYLTRLRAQAIIEWKHDDLRKAYEQHLKKSATPSTGSPSSEG